MQLSQTIPRGTLRRFRPAALGTLIGGGLVLTGALLPWLRLFAGLDSLSGVQGLYGRLLLGGGVATIALGLARIARPSAGLRGTTALLGGLLTGVASYVVAQAMGAVRSVDGMLLPTLGPGTFVALIGAILVLVSAVPGVSLNGTAIPRTRVLTWIVALFVGLAGAIHLTVAPAHLTEHRALGIGFVAAGLIQLGIAVLFTGAVSRRTLLAVMFINAAFVVAWGISRTTGFPFGPDAGVPEAAGFADIVTVVFEVLSILGSIALLRLAPRDLGRRSATVLLGLTLVIAVSLGVMAIVSGSGVLAVTPAHG